MTVLRGGGSAFQAAISRTVYHTSLNPFLLAGTDFSKFKIL